MRTKVLETCPYCASGCQLYLIVEDGKVIKAEPADGRTNQKTLCLKGHYGWDYLNDPQILTRRLQSPMIRKNGVLEPVSWEEAIKSVADNLSAIKDKYGPDSIMMTGCARGSGNEANYIMQKFARATIGTNNIDHCARVCHGPTLPGLVYCLGDGAMSNSIEEIEDTDLIFVFGYNGADSHPIVARRIAKAKEKGAKIIVVDPRQTETSKFADLQLYIKGATNMALVNAFAHVLIEEKLYKEDYVKNFTEGFEEYKKIVEKYTPEYAETITGIKADEIRQAIREYAKAKNATILYGMGVCQFSQAVDVVRGLASLGLLTGNYGRANVGIGPVRGQNNVQGACDMGALPSYLPGYQKFTDKKIREKFEKAWGVKIPTEKGESLTEVPKLVLKDKKLKAYYIMGEDPVQSDPNAAEVREALDELEFVIVQDIFMNKTALHADVILPATAWGEHDGVYSSADRGFQRIRKAVEAKGDVKTDWEIICEISTAMGYKMAYKNTEEIWNELIDLCPTFTGATYEKMEKLGGVQWPCTDKSDADKGTSYLYKDNKFTTPSGKGVLFACEWRKPGEEVDDEYPLSLSTVREVGHYSVRTMTGNCRALRALEDEPGRIQMSIEDAKELEVKDGELVRVTSRRGSVITRASVSERIRKGSTFMTYQWWVGACNELTNDALDPISKTPEFKYCAVKVEKMENQEEAEKEVEKEYNEIRRKMGIKIR